MTFKVGQKVVRVSDDWFDYEAGITRIPQKEDPQIGSVYTVIDTGDFEDGQYLMLLECSQENSWAAREFCLCADQADDIALFTSLLNPAKTEVTA